MKLSVKVVEDVDVLTPHGLLFGAHETDELRDKIQELDQAGRTKLLINLSQTTMINSFALGTLFVAHAKYTKRHGTVKISCVAKRAHQVITIVGLALVYGENIHETEEEALASFRAMEAAQSR